MKKTILIMALVMMSLTVLANSPDRGRQEWTYRCSDRTVVQFECGGTQKQATAIGRAWCNNR